jgi:Mannosyl-glycoprotein endo-beta-N-acetylglucosaminidase
MTLRPAGQWLWACIGVLAWALIPCAAASAQTSAPEIRTHEKNRVPACVTPARLTRYLMTRNPDLLPQFRDIARFYKQHGEALRVRWDYAFFQMLIETNFLTYKTGSGRWGDVNPKQNNFAGIGTTGGGVPGDSFPDVSTGVLGQMQHLVAYSGEMVDSPVARRTREKQSDIVSLSRSLKRAVTFRDLARRWAVDRHYARSIEAIAERYRAMLCSGAAVAELSDEERRDTTVQTAAAARERPAAGAGRHAFNAAAMAGASSKISPPATASEACKVWTASYGKGPSVLIRAPVGSETHYTALQVLDGFEKNLSDTFIRTHALGGEAIGEFENREAALTQAFELCPSARNAR